MAIDGRLAKTERRQWYMNKKIFSLFIIGLMVFSVFVVVKPASAATPSNELKIAQLASTGALFMGVFNPAPGGGLTDVYTVRVWQFVNDPALISGPDGVPHNYRCQVVKVERNVQVPNDAVIYNSTAKKWDAVYKTETAKSAVTYKCGLGEWHDGHKMTLADIMFGIAMDFEWTTQDYENDTYYDETWDSWAGDTVRSVMGVKVNELTDDYVTITLYQDYDFPINDMYTASNYVPYASIPWQLYYTMSEMVAHGVNGKKFSWSTQPQNGYQIDMISPDQMSYFKTEAQNLENQGLPAYLSTLTQWLNNWGIDPAKAGFTTDAAKAGFTSMIQWINKHNNAVISNGPYYLDTYKPSSMYLKLLKFTGKRVNFKDETVTYIEGNETVTRPIPFDANFKMIEVHGITNEDTAILEVAKGNYDLYWYEEPGYKFTGILAQGYGGNIRLIKTIGVFWSLVFNPVHDDNNPYLITVGDKVYFNPFAIREVRYAMNWLISRNFIIQNILKGSGGPMYGTPTSGSVIPYQNVNTVANALGMSAQGDKSYALKIIDEALNKTAKSPYLANHTLVKQNGKWLFDGEPIEIKIIARTEDDRLSEGQYVGTLIEEAGFKANVLQWDRKKAVHTVYITDPKTYQWNIYTEGWVASAYSLYPTSSVIQYDVWYAPGVVGWSYTPETTVEDLLKKVGNGDVNTGAQKLGLKYYTGDKLQEILKWTNTQIGPLMYNNKLEYNNKTYSVSTKDQFWDLYKLGEGMLMMDALRVFTVEQWNFFEVSKSVNIGITDPLTGLASTMAVRSLSKPQPTSSTTSKGGGGICGPAALIGLAIVPLLLRRRK